MHSFWLIWVFTTKLPSFLFTIFINLLGNIPK